MTWQLSIALQILASSIMTLFTRQISLTLKKAFYSIGFASYITVAITGWIYGFSFGHTKLTLPVSSAWPYLLIEGLFIPSSWLVQYKLIKYIGASNTVIVAIMNTLVTACLGVIFLHDSLGTAFLLGSVFIVAGTVIALRLRPDTTHNSHVSLEKKIALAACGALLYGVGMFSEKKAINIIGVWHYAQFGWSMQALGALLILVLIGRKELSNLSNKALKNGAILGLLTSIAGCLYIYAVSKGSLSRTIIATSGKAAIVMVFAYLLLRERNELKQRLTALILTAIGLSLIVL